MRLEPRGPGSCRQAPRNRSILRDALLRPSFAGLLRMRQNESSSRENHHGAQTDRHLDAAAKRRAGRSAGQSSDHRIHRPQAKSGRHAALLPGAEGGGSAGRPGVGGRARAAVDAQRHAHRCAVALSPDHEPRARRRGPSTKSRSNGATSRASNSTSGIFRMAMSRPQPTSRRS